MTNCYKSKNMADIFVRHCIRRNTVLNIPENECNQSLTRSDSLDRQAEVNPEAK